MKYIINPSPKDSKERKINNKLFYCNCEATIVFEKNLIVTNSVALTDFDKRIDLSMKNVVELGVYDLTILLADRICMKNSTEEDNVRRRAVINRRPRS